MTARETPTGAMDVDLEAGGDTVAAADNDTETVSEAVRPKEIGGRDGPDPTRYGDWEKNGRCIDF